MVMKVVLDPQQPLLYSIIWVFPIIGVPQNGWFITENPIKKGWFEGTPIFGNIHIYSTLDIHWSSRRKALPCLWLQSTSLFTHIISRLTLGQILLNKGRCSNHLTNTPSRAPYPHVGFHSPGFAFEHQELLDNDQWTATHTTTLVLFSNLSPVRLQRHPTT